MQAIAQQSRSGPTFENTIVRDGKGQDSSLLVLMGSVSERSPAANFESGIGKKSGDARRPPKLGGPSGCDPSLDSILFQRVTKIYEPAGLTLSNPEPEALAV